MFVYGGVRWCMEVCVCGVWLCMVDSCTSCTGTMMRLPSARVIAKQRMQQVQDKSGSSGEASTVTAGQQGKTLCVFENGGVRWCTVMCGYMSCCGCECSYMVVYGGVWLAHEQAAQILRYPTTQTQAALTNQAHSPKKDQE